MHNYSYLRFISEGIDSEGTGSGDATACSHGQLFAFDDRPIL